MPSSQDSLRVLAIGVVVALVIAAGFVFGVPVAILMLAGFALVGGILLIWMSVQSLTGETPLSLEEALTLGAPSAEEEQKRAILRALKDLEYERSVGKITNEDYQELFVRYRAEALRLMQALDENLKPARARAEKLLKARLAEAGLAPASDAAAPESKASAEPESNGAQPESKVSSTSEPESNGAEPPSTDSADDASPTSSRAQAEPAKASSERAESENQAPEEPTQDEATPSDANDGNTTRTESEAKS